MGIVARGVVAATVVGMVVAWAQAGATTRAGAASGPVPTTRRSETLPQTPGHHRLRFVAELGGKTIEMAYALYLPRDYPRTTGRKPMLTFLMGAGECGDDHAGIFVHGPAAELMRNPKLDEGLDLIVLSPQCPKDRRWDEEEMVGAVLQLMDYVMAKVRVDPARQYLTGLSMGGKGTWMIALAAPKQFAAIVPLSAAAVEPERAAALAGTAVWIIVGGADGSFLDGSRQMAGVLKKAGADVTLTEVPGSGHDTWGRFYPRRGFYDFLVANVRGKPAPKDRLTPEQLLAIGYTPPAEPAYVKQFQTFAPWWHLLNCGNEMDPGLKAECMGKQNVFVTHPASEQVPCMLQITWPVPTGKKTTLRLTVGRHPQGDWRLIVRADGKDLLSRDVDKGNAPGGWMDVEVDLSGYAGKQVRLELLNAATGWNNEAGYWAPIRIESK